jgi:ribonuclease D
MTPTFENIVTLSDLESLAKKLSKEAVIAVDIEADSLHHYSPRVCLIQISTTENTYIIDPLSTEAIAPLGPLLAGRKTKKVFHGGDYDLRSLYRDFSIAVRNIFDTMVASQFLGEKEVSLAAVLKARFDLTLNKKYQKADWSKRPLTNDMLVYAARDTDHLVSLYHQLAHELDSKGRLDWVEEECAVLSVVCSTPNKAPWACGPEAGDSSRQKLKNATGNLPLFNRFKGAGTLPRRDLAVLEELLAFRDRTARKQDRPPFKVFGNNLIKKLVTTKPTDLSAIERIPGLPRNFMKRYAKNAVAAIKRGLSIPNNRLPAYPRTPRRPRNPKKQARLLRLKAWRDDKAKAFALDPGILCSNALLDAAAEWHPKNVHGLKTVPGMKKWQVKVLGKEMIRVMHDNN